MGAHKHCSQTRLLDTADLLLAPWALLERLSFSARQAEDVLAGDLEDRDLVYGVNVNHRVLFDRVGGIYIINQVCLEIIISLLDDLN